MSHEKSPRSLWDELFDFEKRLRKGSRIALGDARDSELTQILQRIALRRQVRDAPPETTSHTTTAAGRVLSVTKLTSHLAILQLGKPADFRFQPGQYVKLGLPEGKRNRYTIASAPSDPHLEFCIEAVPAGRVAPHLIALAPGARVDMKHKAKGEFLLVPNAATHVMLATCTGISPFRSMLRDAIARGALRSRFVILHGASFADELVYRDELTALAQQFPEHIRYVPSVSRPGDPRNSEFQGLTGRVADLAPALLKELQASRPERLQVYACGHPEMVAAAHDRLEPLGLPVLSEVFD